MLSKPCIFGANHIARFETCLASCNLFFGTTDVTLGKLLCQWLDVKPLLCLLSLQQLSIEGEKISFKL